MLRLNTPKILNIVNNKQIKLNRVYKGFYFGDQLTFLDTLSIYSLTKESLPIYQLYNKTINLGNFWDGSKYLLSMDFNDFRKYDSFLFFGFNPRYEASLLNICFARLKELENSSFFSFNSATENFFLTAHKGPHIKTLLSLIEGKSKSLLVLRNCKRVKILYGLNMFNSSNNITKVFDFLETKFLINTSFMSNDLSVLHYLELYGGSRYQKYYESFSQKKNVLSKGWFFNSTKTKEKTNRRIYSDIFEFNIRPNLTSENTQSSKGCKTFIPINSFYERNDWVISVFGQMLKTEKVATPEITPSFSIQNWLHFFYFFDWEKKTNFNKFLMYRLSKKKSSGIILNQLALNNFNHSLYGASNKNSILSYFLNLNLYNCNHNQFIHNFNLNKKIRFDKFTLENIYVQENITNFYISSKLLNYSSTMTNLSYLHTTSLLLK